MVSIDGLRLPHMTSRMKERVLAPKIDYRRLLTLHMDLRKFGRSVTTKLRAIAQKEFVSWTMP